MEFENAPPTVAVIIKIEKSATIVAPAIPVLVKLELKPKAKENIVPASAVKEEKILAKKQSTKRKEAPASNNNKNNVMKKAAKSSSNDKSSTVTKKTKKLTK